MRKQACGLLASSADIAVVGVTEVFSKIGSFIMIKAGIRKFMDQMKPNLVILIDFPDFNLNIVARAAKKKNIKIFYYISPQVWAWREGRVRQIKKLVDKMAVILPFEVDFYHAHGFPVHYVGHPLKDTVKTGYTRSGARRHFGLLENQITIGLLPGSRTAEVDRLLPAMIEAAQIISKKYPARSIFCPWRTRWTKKRLPRWLPNPESMSKSPSDRFMMFLPAATRPFVTSGTATLETGLMGVPMIIVYKVSLFSEMIARMIIRQQHIGLVNIIAGKTIAPELLQRDASGPRIASEALAILLNDSKKQDVIAQLNDIRAKLGEPGAAGRAAQLACDML